MASVCCFCGETEINFVQSTIRYVIQCGCCDCFQKVDWAISEAKKSKTLHGRKEGNFMTTNLILETDIESIKGEENLKIFKLRETGKSLFCVATCCHSVLLLNSPSYKGNIVGVIEEACIQKGFKNYQKPCIRLMIKDWDKRKGNSIEFETQNLTNETAVHFGDERDTKESLKKAFSKFDVSESKFEKKGKLSVQDIFDKYGPSIDLNLKEYELLH